MKLDGVVKIRRDSYLFSLDWNYIQNLIREDVEKKLQDPEFMKGEPVKLDGPLRFQGGQIEIKMRQLEEGSPSYRVDKFAAKVDVHLKPPNLPPEA